ncbi:PREDICTED: interferon beta [Condylura cristata]|uniref:interferon beta n=1 Tax=Condylura cristata TaxID=143302 RepID=UPI000334445C|nr:PREDICTED: interferon beta [Condylura cristata]
MPNRCILQAALLVCFCTRALSGNYSLLRSQQRRSNLESQRILGQLNGSDINCLKLRLNSTLPEEVKHPPRLQKEDALLITDVMLQQIFQIFGRNYASTGWDESIIKKLNVNLYEQIKQLKTAMGEIAEKDNFPWSNKIIRKLKKYYFNLVCYLQVNEYSSCAWVIVKRDIFRSIFFLNKLTDYLPD